MTAVCTYLEAILFAAGEPVPLSRLSLVLGVSELEVLDAAQELQNLLDEGGHGICLIRLADKLQLCTRAETAGAVTKILEQRRPPSLSSAAMETLAIVA
jgi:segregation and condensation protein B